MFNKYVLYIFLSHTRTHARISSPSLIEMRKYSQSFYESTINFSVNCLSRSFRVLAQAFFLRWARWVENEGSNISNSSQCGSARVHNNRSPFQLHRHSLRANSNFSSFANNAGTAMIDTRSSRPSSREPLQSLPVLGTRIESVAARISLSLSLLSVARDAFNKMRIGNVDFN